MHTAARLLSTISIALIATTAAGAATPPSKNDLVIEGRRGLDTNERLVTFRDLSLADASGRNALVRRVGFAIGTLCDGMRVTDPVGALECNKVAWGSARAQLSEVMPAR